MTTTDRGARTQPKKRPYRTPKLTIHGNLKEMTLAKGSSNPDGVGKPKSRVATGGPG